MGGAAGHINHVWEVHDFTFGQLRDLINKSFDGRLENITEKLDGQNILITYKNGKVLASRSTKHLKNFGEDALDIYQMGKYFRDRGTPCSVERAYVTAMEDFELIFKGYHANVMENGSLWINVEILHQENENVIPYFKNQLRIHHVRLLDKDGKTLSTFSNDLITHIVKDAEALNTVYEIKKTNSITIKETCNHQLQGHLHHKLNLMQEATDLNDDSTIEDYLHTKIFEYAFAWIIREYHYDDEDFCSKIADRWARGIKNPPINKLLEGVPEPVQKWVREHDSNSKSKVDFYREQFVEIFTELGIWILNNLEGLATADPDKAVVKIKEKLKTAILHAQGKDEMSDHLWRLENAGNLKSVVPTEGIVFEYEGQMLKLSGSFIPQLRLIGFYRFR